MNLTSQCYLRENIFPLLLGRVHDTLTQIIYVGFHHATRWKTLLEKATLFWRRLNCCRMAKKTLCSITTPSRFSL